MTKLKMPRLKPETGDNDWGLWQNQLPRVFKSIVKWELIICVLLPLLVSYFCYTQTMVPHILSVKSNNIVK